MLFTAALSLFLSFGSSLVAASIISNTTTLRRGCGFVPSEEFVIQAEADFANNKVTVEFEVGITLASIPVYCGLHFSPLFLRCGEADAGLFCRACDL